MGFDLPYDPHKYSRCDRFFAFGRLRSLAEVLHRAGQRQVSGKSVRRRPLGWVGWWPNYGTKAIYRNGHQARLYKRMLAERRAKWVRKAS